MDEDKNTILFMSFGKEGQRQFLGQPRSYDFTRNHHDFAKDASNYFRKNDNIDTTSPATTSGTSPRGYETVWMMELRIMSAESQWEQEDDMLATRLIHGCYTEKARGLF